MWNNYGMERFAFHIHQLEFVFCAIFQHSLRQDYDSTVYDICVHKMVFYWLRSSGIEQRSLGFQLWTTADDYLKSGLAKRARGRHHSLGTVGWLYKTSYQ